MTAPSAPHIWVRTDGIALYVRWLPVLDAVNYNLYVGETAAPSGLEDTIPDDDIETDGWFLYVFDPHIIGHCYVRLTALNAGDEESAASEVYKFLGGINPPPDDGTIARKRHRQTA
jgi:hypothetical protein